MQALLLRLLWRSIIVHRCRGKEQSAPVKLLFVGCPGCQKQLPPTRPSLACEQAEYLTQPTTLHLVR